MESHQHSKEEKEMRDYYVVRIVMQSGKQLVSSMMLLSDAEALAEECKDMLPTIVFVCQQ